MNKAQQLLAEISEFISKSQLDEIEKKLDALFSSLGIDIEFTKHFFERLNDKRNQTDITVEELVKIYTDTHKKFGTRIKNMNKGAEAMLLDMKSNINIPFVIAVDKDEIVDMTAKTVMRKKNFQTRTKRLVV